MKRLSDCLLEPLFRNRRLFTFSLVCLTAGILTIVLTAGAVKTSAQEPSETISQIQEEHISQDRIPELINQDWQSLPFEEYQSLRNSARPGLKSTWISEAEYTATFLNETLEAGTLTAEVKHNGKQPELLLLDPLNLVVTELNWDRGPAVWGSTPGGNAALQVAGNQTHLNGKWSLKGRKLPGSVEFDLRTAPATVSRMRLRIPEHMVLKSSAGLVTGPLPSDMTGWSFWRVELGSRTECRLTVSSQSQPTGMQPLILADTITTYEVGHDGLHFKTRVNNLEVYESPATHLDFAMPRGVEIEEVLFGNETSLPFEIRKTGNNSRLLLVSLPDPVLGRVRSLQIGAYAPALLDRRWTLPTLKLHNAVFMKGEVHLTVNSPLQLRLFQTRGIHQTETVFDSVQREQFSFQQFLPDARLRVEVGHPQLDLTTRVFTHLNYAPDFWTLNSDVQWKAISGTTFQTVYSIPPRWEITEVRLRRNNSEYTSAANWHVTKQASGGNLLEVEFPESLEPDSPRTVQILARGTSGVTNDALKLPVIVPENCRVIAQETAVTHPASVTPELSADSSLKQVSREEISQGFRESSLWDDVSSTADGELLLLSQAWPQTGGTLSFPDTIPAVNADVSIEISCDEDSVREVYRATIQPLSSSVSRVLIFVATPADATGDQKPSMNWEWIDGQNPPRKLEAERISPSAFGKQDRYAEREGEMWAIELPSLTTEEFEIRATRVRSELSRFAPSLLLVPGADEFRGIVELNVAEEFDVELETQGLTPVSPGSDLPGSSNLSDADAATGRRVWRYEGDADPLSLLVNTRGFSQTAHRAASLKLRSLIQPEEGGYDMHRAVFHLKEDTRPGQFRFELPHPALLTTVRLNGTAVEPLRDGTGFVLPPIPQNRENSVVIQYRRPSTGSLIRDVRNVVLPVMNYRILHFDWEFALPPGIRPEFESELMLLNQPPAQLAWKERFFGPLGQSVSTGGNEFNSVRQVAQPGTDSNHTGEGSGNDAWAPMHWSIYRASAAEFSESLSLEIWSTAKIRLLGWVALLFCFVVGILLRRGEIKHREKLCAAWLTVCTIGASVSPTVFAIVVGGGISGTLLAIFLPQRVIRGQLILFPTRDNRKLGSTASFRNVPSTTMLIVLGLLFTRCLAQSTPSETNRSSETPADRSPIRSLSDFTVLFPQNGDAEASGRPAVVYLRKQLVDRLKQTAKNRLDASKYLLTSVDYLGRIDRQKLVTIEAKFRIAVLSPEKTTRVRLPITNANPGGSDSCLVNGSPQPLIQSPDGRGFIVELEKPADVPVEAVRPDQDGSDRDKTVSASGSRATMYEVLLRLHPPIVPDMKGGRFQIGLPRVTASRFTLTVEDEAATARILGSLGKTSRTDAPRTSITDLGRTNDLQVIWSTDKEPVEVPVELKAKVACLVDVHPTRLEFRYRVSCDVLAGKADYVTWNLPREMVVRSVESEQLLRYSASPVSSGDSRLLLEFSSSQQKNFVVDAATTLPIRSAKNPVTIPPVNLFANLPESYATKVTAYQMGVATSPGFEITPKLPFDERVTSLSPDAFASFPAADESLPSLGKPQFAYRLETPVATAFEFSPVTPHRKIRALRMIGHVRRSKIKWTLSAEIEVTTPTSPAFQHRLVLDPRLEIDTAIVREDDVDRLVRKAFNGNRLDLFLSEKTTGVQHMTLQGFLPVAMSKNVRLPQIRFADADAEQLEILLYRDPDVGVEFPDADAPTTTGTAEVQGSNGFPGIYLGRLRLSPEDPLPIIRPVPLDTRLSFDKASLLSRQPDGTRKLATIFHVVDPNQVATKFSVHVPAELTVDFQILASPGERRTKTLTDGSLEVTFEQPRPAPGDFTISMTSTLLQAESGTGPLPTISAVDAELKDHFLLLPSRSVSAPGDEESAVELAQADLPQWILDSTSIPTATEEAKIYKGSQDAWNLRKPAVSSGTPESHVPLILTHVQYDRSPGEFGRTEFFLLSRSRSHLELDWPADAHLRALIVNGRVLNSPAAAAGALKIPLDSTQEAYHVQIHWMREVNDFPMQIGSQSRKYPLPQNVHVERSLLTVVPPKQSRFIATGGLNGLDAREYHRERLEGLLNLTRECYRNGTGHPQIWKTIDATLRDFERYSKHRAVKSNAGDGELQTNRFDEITAEIENLLKASGYAASESEQGDDPFLSSGTAPAETFEIAENRNRRFGRLPTEDAEATTTFWIIGNDLIRWVAAVLGFIIVFPLLRRLITLQAGQWLSRHQWISWFLIGLFWLLCLKPAFIGFFAWLIGVLTTIRQRQQAAHPSQTAEQSAG